MLGRLVLGRLEEGELNSETVKMVTTEATPNS